MIRIVLIDPAVHIERSPDGQTKRLVFTDQKSGVEVVVPMPTSDAKQIGTSLAAGIEVAPANARFGEPKV